MNRFWKKMWIYKHSKKGIWICKICGIEVINNDTRIKRYTHSRFKHPDEYLIYKKKYS